ncbi:MAG: Gfo/Idh/MocA family oxidoreductase [Ruminococcaceae bacterium]|nr:Gfo/Idh/MocA family oxidoreductase [Oscillospiraceae bacterium]
MNKKITIAVIGCGSFAKFFVPLFLKHPTVEKVYVCDLIKDRANEYSKSFNVEIIDTFEAVINRDDITAVAIFTERHTHGDLVVRALNAGKDVYSAVPMAICVEDCKNIIEAVKASGKIYMMGETCIYYPCSMYCKERYENGDFGKFVYGESQYFHDISHFPKNFIDNRKASAVPPFYYPTHSTAMLLHATDTYATKVTAFGYVDTEENTQFAVGENHWDNTFSNEFSLMQLANGGIARVSECRRIGYKAPSSFISDFYGTKGSYQFNNAQHLVTKLTPTGVDLEDVSDQVNPIAMTENKGEENFKQKVANHQFQWNSFSPTHSANVEKLPEEFKAIPEVNGHMASHQLLIDDFCTAVYNGTMPYVNAWRAARFTIPGLIAHESALKGGIPLEIPDFGEAPKK